MTYGIALGQAILLERRAEQQDREAHYKNCSQKCFVKASGDVFLNEAFLTWVVHLARDNWVVISIGGGTQINDALAALGIASDKHPQLGRETTAEGYAIALKVLEKNKSDLEWQLRQRNAIAEVVIPVITMAGHTCHVDGDLMVLNAYWGFDELYVVTTRDRVEAKEKLFADLTKVMVISA